jgi:hypothetical protein
MVFFASINYAVFASEKWQITDKYLALRSLVGRKEEFRLWLEIE